MKTHKPDTHFFHSFELLHQQDPRCRQNSPTSPTQDVLISTTEGKWFVSRRNNRNWSCNKNATNLTNIKKYLLKFCHCWNLKIEQRILKIKKTFKHMLDHFLCLLFQMPCWVWWCQGNCLQLWSAAAHQTCIHGWWLTAWWPLCPVFYSSVHCKNSYDTLFKQSHISLLK